MLSNTRRAQAVREQCCWRIRANGMDAGLSSCARLAANVLFRVSFPRACNIVRWRLRVM